MPTIASELLKKFIDEARSQISRIKAEIPNIPVSETKSLLLLLALEHMYRANIDKLRMALKEIERSSVAQPSHVKIENASQGNCDNPFSVTDHFPFLKLCRR